MTVARESEVCMCSSKGPTVHLHFESSAVTFLLYESVKCREDAVGTTMLCDILCSKGTR